jgi:hypothetical protein
MACRLKQRRSGDWSPTHSERIAGRIKCWGEAELCMKLNVTPDQALEYKPKRSWALEGKMLAPDSPSLYRTSFILSLPYLSILFVSLFLLLSAL